MFKLIKKKVNELAQPCGAQPASRKANQSFQSFGPKFRSCTLEQEQIRIDMHFSLLPKISGDFLFNLLSVARSLLIFLPAEENENLTQGWRNKELVKAVDEKPQMCSRQGKC
ncbi:hypothetical protein T07_3296 [Trichinella nelsoni]|uniref:Uncharacterized protein n=1 Tax=Trichinella nelsoni TaxID=6336 RepID=A0A0V0RKC2_9BILA|nr:hypothetical protein T07_3296 [Trichinella nelsoni]